MSYCGFYAEYRVALEGDISPKVWRLFKKTIVAAHAPNWKIQKRARRDSIYLPMYTTIKFSITNRELVLVPVDWEFIKASICLLVNTV